MTTKAPLDSLGGYHAALKRGIVDIDALVGEFPPPPLYMDRAAAEPTPADVQEARFCHVLDIAATRPFYQRLWAEAGVRRDDIRGLEDINKLPSFDVEDLRMSIERKPPFGDHQQLPDGALTPGPYRVYFSGGTTGVPRPALYSVRDRELGSLMMARTLWMQGIRPGDVVLVSWSYGTHQGAWVYDEALYKWIGCLVVPSSTGNVTASAKQLEFAARYGAASIFATSDYLIHLAALAIDLGYDLERDFQFTSFPTIMDTAGVQKAWNRPAYNCWGTYELQTVTAECESHQGMHVFDDAYIVEIQPVQGGTDQPDDGRGDLVVTNLYAETFPMIRFNTRDVSRFVSHERCRCGMYSPRIDSIYGRSDTMVKLRGINVWAEALGRVVIAAPGANGEYFCRVEKVDGRDEMTILVEVDGQGGDERLATDLHEQIKRELEVSVAVQVVDRDALVPLTGRGVRSKPKRFEDLRVKEDK